jgi:hypothetical protein
MQQKAFIQRFVNFDVTYTVHYALHVMKQRQLLEPHHAIGNIHVVNVGMCRCQWFCPRRQLFTTSYLDLRPC